LTKASLVDSQLFIFKLRQGFHEIDDFWFGSRSIDVPSGYLTFEIPDDQDVYTLGTVYVKVQPPPPRDRSDEKAYKEMGSPGGAVGTAIIALTSGSAGACCPLEVRPERDEKRANATLAPRFGGITPTHIWLKVDRISHRG